jgi:membrane associated rhomboid family serine protease
MSRHYRTSYSSIGFPRWTRAVKIIVIACVITFVVELISGKPFIDKFALTPDQVIKNGYVWQLVTYIFLHDRFSPLHILFNMLGLWMFGSELEQTWGTRQFTRFFFVCGIGAGVVMVVLFLLTQGDPLVSTIGASGAVYGILLAFGILFPDRIIYWVIFPIPAKYFVMILGGIALFSSLMTANSGVAHVAHLGGMLCGFIYMKSRGMLPRRHHRRRISAGFRFKDWYGQWQRRRLRRKFDVYYNRRHGNGGNTDDDEKWRRWKN